MSFYMYMDIYEHLINGGRSRDFNRNKIGSSYLGWLRTYPHWTRLEAGHSRHSVSRAPSVFQRGEWHSWWPSGAPCCWLLSRQRPRPRGLPLPGCYRQPERSKVTSRSHQGKVISNVWLRRRVRSVYLAGLIRHVQWEVLYRLFGAKRALTSIFYHRVKALLALNRRYVQFNYCFGFYGTCCCDNSTYSVIVI